MSERKPPPMYAVWNETDQDYAWPATGNIEDATANLRQCVSDWPGLEFRLIRLTEQPEPPQ